MPAEPTPPGGTTVGSGVGGLISTVKHGARHLTDRMIEPYVDRTVERVASRMSPASPVAEAPPAAPLPPPFATCHGSLHEGRTMALADMPAGCDTVLSMGANGQWYFDWFDDHYAHIPRHIGVEAYMPRPDVLPDNVEWVEADLASPEGVAMLGSGTVDMVFSGQNIEHLWPDQVQAFLVESSRVLRGGGGLVLDSPNRELTADYQWSMGEHTIEFTPDEAIDLLALAGFDVVTMKGIWLCRQAGELLPLEPPGTVEGSADVLRRMILATQRPEDSFIWWAEARKAREPDVEGLGSAVRAIFDANWRERVGRMRAGDAATVTDDGEQRTAVVAKGVEDYVVLGPWMALRAGPYQFSVDIDWSGFVEAGATPAAVLEVLAGDELIESSLFVPTTPEGTTTLSCPFELDELRFAVHARLRGTGAAGLRVPLTLAVHPDPYGVDRAG